MSNLNKPTLKFLQKSDIINSVDSVDLQAAGFEGKFGEHFFSYKTFTLYLGIEFVTENLMINDFEKANYYDLGLEVCKLLPKSATEITIDNSNCSIEDLVKLVTGIRQGEYKFQGNQEITKSHLEISFLSPIDPKVIEETEKISQGVSLSRNLLNMRADYLNPASYPEILNQNLQNLPSWANVKVISKETIDELGMNWLAGVGRSSKHGYKIIVIELNPQNPPTNTIALVGKGLTFDNGGVNIKENGFSLGMHADMGGSAIVFGTARALTLLEQPKNTKYVFVSGVVENGLDANALHPGDILENIVGQTTMVKNTDAEGRLTLGDVAPWTIINYAPSKIVTLATLTGHAVLAYTAKVAPIFANDINLQNEIYSAFLNTQEEAIVGVLPKNVEKAIVDESKLADTINTHNYKRQGGAQSAAAYVMRTSQPKLWKKNRPSNLPDYVPTAHLDVAGPVTDEGSDLATGYAVRSMVEFCRQQDKI